jgi:hypothetical protein
MKSTPGVGVGNARRLKESSTCCAIRFAPHDAALAGFFDLIQSGERPDL